MQDQLEFQQRAYKQQKISRRRRQQDERKTGEKPGEEEIKREDKGWR